MTSQLVEKFLERLRAEGRSASALQTYGTALGMLYRFLPEDKLLDSGSGPLWREHLKEQGYSPRTINHRISAFNSFVRCLGRRQWQIENLPLPADRAPVPSLTREEYLRLLAAAKGLGKERSYLLIKTMGGAGVGLQDLPLVTVETVEAGAGARPGGEAVSLSGALQEELLDYARRAGISQGPVFITRGGALMNRSQVWKAIQFVCPAAGVPLEKGSPRCLTGLFQRTRRELAASAAGSARQTYEDLLEEEQKRAGWEG